MKIIYIWIIMLFIISSCSLIESEEIKEEVIILTAEEIEELEREKFEAIIAEEDKKNIEIIQKQKQLEIENVNKLYEETRKDMTQEELKEEEALLNLNKMTITPIEK